MALDRDNKHVNKVPFSERVEQIRRDAIEASDGTPDSGQADGFNGDALPVMFNRWDNISPSRRR